MKFWLHPSIAVAYNRGCSPRTVAQLEALVDSNKSRIEDFWNEYRTLGVPLTWYPRLLHATPAQREKFWLSPRGLHWDEIDEDISLEGLLAGRRDQTTKRTVAA